MAVMNRTRREKRQEGSRGEIGPDKRLADQQTTDYKEEISRIKTYPRSGQIDIGIYWIHFQKDKVAFVAGEDVQGRSLDDVQQLTKQVRTAACSIESVRSQICRPDEAALPVTIDFEACFCKILCVWHMDNQR